ncbi:MAG TPA: Flp pilus assembly protein CpaB [Terriglobales bacterium]|jgi:pilus assembly protein CpaB|nr:Flp pilus assembly protein CpaB [Terriglobales bacterium]
MNRNRLLMIGFIALIVGAVASSLVYRNLQSGRGGDNGPGEDVLVAADDLQVGTKIEDNDIRFVHFPSASLPAGVFHRKDKVLGRGVIIPISKGEFILTNKLAGENAGSGLPALIPPGMRAVSVRVNDTTSVSGFVQPGTRVDVMLTGNPAGSSEQQTTTILENIAVLATGTRMERNAAGEPRAAPVVTLLVTPDDAQKLTLASNQGHIQLSLRSPLDTKEEELSAARSGELYKFLPQPPPVVTHKEKRVAPPPPPPPPAAYTVEIYKGDKKEEDKF